MATSVISDELPLLVMKANVAKLNYYYIYARKRENNNANLAISQQLIIAIFISNMRQAN